MIKLQCQQALILVSKITLALFCTISLAAQDSASSEVPKLPAPAGQFAVGTSVFHLTDRSRRDPVANEYFREIMVQVWFPANHTAQTANAPYFIDTGLLSAMKKDTYLNVKNNELEIWAKIKTHSVAHAQINGKPKKLPLLLFSPGYSVARANYTSILEEMASHGYIVAAIDHPYSGMMVLPDGRSISFADDKRKNVQAERVESMSLDALYVLNSLLNKKSVIGNRFAKAIDDKRVGMFGHSLGGATALEICRISTRFNACVDIDGSVWGKVETEGVNRPYLVILNVPSELKRPPETMRKARDEEWVGVVSKKETKAFIVKIEGTWHFSFGDFPFLLSDTKMKENGADIEPSRIHKITSALLRDFFSFYVNGRKGELPFSSVKPLYKEVSIEEFHR